MSTRPSVVYVMPDKMGGALTIMANLLACRRPDGFEYRVVLTHNHLHHDARSSLALAADSQASVEYSLPTENLASVLRRLHRAIGPGPGVLVCNDHLDLLLAASRAVDRTVVQIVHGDYDYYYDLATQHEPYVHAFVAISRTVYEQLIARLPSRRDSIFWLPTAFPSSISAGRRPTARCGCCLPGGSTKQKASSTCPRSIADCATRVSPCVGRWSETARPARA